MITTTLKGQTFTEEELRAGLREIELATARNVFGAVRSFDGRDFIVLGTVEELQRELSRSNISKHRNILAVPRTWTPNDQKTGTYWRLWYLLP